MMSAINQKTQTLHFYAECEKFAYNRLGSMCAIAISSASEVR